MGQRALLRKKLRRLEDQKQRRWEGKRLRKIAESIAQRA